MNEDFELLRHIYKDSEMSVYSLSDLLDKLKDKDNKINGCIEDILHDYEKFLDVSKELLSKNDVKVEGTGKSVKLAASVGISREVKHDNSDSSMADMLIQGIAMGSIDMEKKIKNYKGEVDKEVMKIAKDFLKFQQDAIEKLKKYL